MDAPIGTRLAFMRLGLGDIRDRRVIAEIAVYFGSEDRQISSPEFIVQELVLGGNPYILLNIYTDSFGSIQAMPEFFAALTEKRPHTMAETETILLGLGAVDETPSR